MGNDGAAETPTYYTGKTVPVYCGWDLTEDTPIVKNAQEGKFKLANLEGSKYTSVFADGNLGVVKIAYGSWAVVGVLFAAAALLLIITAVKTKSYKQRMKHYAILPILPYIGLVTDRQFIFLCAALATFLISLIVCCAKLSKQKKTEAAARAAKIAKTAKKAPVTPVAEKAPVVEEAPAVEEAPVVEEAPAEEEPAKDSDAE